MDRALETVKDMFSQREYTDITEGENGYLSAIKPNGNKIYVNMNLIEKANIEEIKSCVAFLNQEEVKHCLLIYNGNPTPAVKSFVNACPDIGLQLELFSLGDLQFNITKHYLVPKHILLSKDDARKFKEKIGLQIAILLKSDPIARFYNFSKGDIIKVIRSNGFISYRIVR